MCYVFEKKLLKFAESQGTPIHSTLAAGTLKFFYPYCVRFMP